MATSLKKLVGHEVLIMRREHPKPIRATLKGVELGGIWIEAQVFTDSVLDSIDKTMLEATPLFFVPFSSIRFLTTAHEFPALSEGALGLEPR